MIHRPGLFTASLVAVLATAPWIVPYLLTLGYIALGAFAYGTGAKDYLALVLVYGIIIGILAAMILWLGVAGMIGSFESPENHTTASHEGDKQLRSEE